MRCCGDHPDPVIRPPSRPLIREQIAGGIALGAIPLILQHETRVKSPLTNMGDPIWEKYPNILFPWDLPSPNWVLYYNWFRAAPIKVQ